MDQSRRNADAPNRTFHPPHCTNIDCPSFEPNPGWSPRREGFYVRASDQHRFQRFRCPTCRRRFSTRTFSPTYWLRRRDLLPLIARLSTEGPGIRQIARIIGISHSTVLRHLSRAGRHCLLFHRTLLQGAALGEPLVVDGFETFEFSQFFPFHLNLAVAADSWMILHFTDSPLRRKGSMTAEQKHRRRELEARLGRPDPKAVEIGIVDLLRPLAPCFSLLHLHTDDHPAYRRALHCLRALPQSPEIRHDVTPSIVRRTTSNPLFPVNLADLLLRHGQAAHRRETIAFSKRRQGAIERLAVFTVWRNYVKDRREKKPGPTAAMEAGILMRRLRWRDVFRRRLFPRREGLPEPWWSYYWRQIRTAALGNRQTVHMLKYAF